MEVKSVRGDFYTLLAYLNWSFSTMSAYRLRKLVTLFFLAKLFISDSFSLSLISTESLVSFLYETFNSLSGFLFMFLKVARTPTSSCISNGRYEEIRSIFTVFLFLFAVLNLFFIRRLDRPGTDY